MRFVLIHKQTGMSHRLSLWPEANTNDSGTVFQGTALGLVQWLKENGG